jgi:flagellar motor switch/type III secretory pathway protein FliN
MSPLAAAPLTLALAAVISEEMWEEAAFLPCLLSIDLQVRNFTIRDLLRMESGTILESGVPNGADVPVLVNAHLVGWAEFEIVGRSLGVRMTELA